HQARRERERAENEERLQAKARAKLADLAAQTHGADDAQGAEARRKRAIIEAALAKAKARQVTKT
ncbi:MAG: electron transport complex subunit RsxB, partial [Betaproteobacteria bacterium]|nr:electron transport complex subunit RsxB [Betaproteobacteria bacterium]